MSNSISGGINKWLNSSSYDEWIRNADELLEHIDPLIHIDGSQQKDCVKIFYQNVAKYKNVIDLPMAKWSLLTVDTDNVKIRHLLKKLKNLLSRSDPELGVFLSKINPTYLLLEAASEGDLKFVQEAVRSNINVNVQDSDGVTPLLYAAEAGNHEILQLLLDAGADPAVKDLDGNTPLMAAAGSDDLNCVFSLLETGKAAPNETNRKGHNAFYHACNSGNLEIVKLLLKHKPDINLQNKRGRTVLVDLLLYNSKADRQVIALLVDKLNPASRLMHKEILRLIAVAHSANIAGVSHIQSKEKTHIPVKLEGGSPAYWLKKMCKTTEIISKHYPELIDEEESKLLIHFLKSGNTGRMQRKDVPQLMMGGFNKHTVAFMTFGPYFVISNRGEGGKKPVEVFKFDANKFDKNIFDSIVASDKLSQENYEKLIDEILPKSLGFTQGPEEELLESLCGLPFQTAGNCSYAQPEQAVLVFMILKGFIEDSNQDFGKIKEKFDEWAAFNQMYHLEGYLGPRHLRKDDDWGKNLFTQERRSVYALDPSLIKASLVSIIKTIPKNSERLDDLKHILAKTLSFSREDSIVQDYKDAQKLMDSLLTPNVDEVLKEFIDKAEG